MVTRKPAGTGLKSFSCSLSLYLNRCKSHRKTWTSASRYACFNNSWPLHSWNGLRKLSETGRLNLFVCFLLSTLRFPPSHPVHWTETLPFSTAHALFPQDYLTCALIFSAPQCPKLGITTTVINMSRKSHEDRSKTRASKICLSSWCWS